MSLSRVFAMILVLWTPMARASDTPSRAIPNIPINCADGIAQQGYCTETVFPPSGFPFSIRYFVVVEKERYPDKEALLAKYFAFSDWPAYAQSTGSDNIIINKSMAMDDIVDEKGVITIRQYFDYKLKSPIGYQKIREVTYNQVLATPYQGALATTEFVIPTTGPQEVPAGEKPLDGAEGLRYQTGSLHLVSCEASKLCSEEQWLVIYESSITPGINLLPRVIAVSAEKAMADLIIGMLFN